ncbi:MAG: thiamine pyrophosphate-binding protein, partial [Actinopolymorphaceae bacterium]
MTGTEAGTESGPGPGSPATLEGHGGDLALAVARAYGVEVMFTLSGAHVFPLYDAAVGGKHLPVPPPVRLVDTRHEATAVF